MKVTRRVLRFPPNKPFEGTLLVRHERNVDLARCTFDFVLFWTRGKRAVEIFNRVESQRLGLAFRSSRNVTYKIKPLNKRQKKKQQQNFSLTCCCSLVDALCGFVGQHSFLFLSQPVWLSKELIDSTRLLQRLFRQS